MTRRLFTHLAQFSSFSSQGELLCTQSLAFFLKNAAARSALAELISERARVSLPPDLSWRPEVRQANGCRPDLVASNPQGIESIKVEAKLDAPFGEGQLVSYAEELKKQREGGLLIVLVPSHRIAKEETIFPEEYKVGDTARWVWSSDPRVVSALISWEEVLEALGKASLEAFRPDLAQFEAMYHVLAGNHIEPVTTDAELLAWRERETDYVDLVDMVTRSLAKGERLMPLINLNEGEYRCRYGSLAVCPLDGKKTCYSVGVRDPFEGHKTPIWLKFDKGTPCFQLVNEQFKGPSFDEQIVRSGGHIWLPLQIPLKVPTAEVVSDLERQVQEILAVALAPFS